jgi:hypothetical protein
MQLTHCCYYYVLQPLKLIQWASIKLQLLDYILIYILSIFHTNTQYTPTHFPFDKIRSYLPLFVQESVHRWHMLTFTACNICKWMNLNWRNFCLLLNKYYITWMKWKKSLNLWNSHISIVLRGHRNSLLLWGSKVISTLSLEPSSFCKTQFIVSFHEAYQ